MHLGPNGKEYATYQLSPPPNSGLTVRSGGYIHPFKTPAGAVVTDVAPADHTHHRGVFLGWVEMHGAVDADFWGWGEHAPIKDRQIINRAVEVRDAGGFTATNEWVAGDTVVLVEKTTVVPRSGRDANIVDITYRLTPRADVTLTQWAFGGFCVRYPKVGLPTVYGPKGVVNLPNPSHIKPSSDWPASPWYAATWKTEGGAAVGVAVVDDPKNPPSLWHNHRDVRMLNPAITAPGAVVLKAGVETVLHYRVVVFDGEVPATLLNRIAGAAESPKTSADWKMELVASTPDVVHPSVVCAAPDGRVFVAEDPMDIREDTPANATKGRIICLNPDGSRTVFAEGLHAVFGMQYLQGNLYVLHNPQLTVFRDDAGVGRDGHDILTHTLEVPWALGWNDHVPANFKLGMDGWFYLAVGDKGLQGCKGSDGRVIDLNGGGIARFRPDGSGLEVFATGVRNILDVALNADDELFTYDNTDEHDWMGRFTHMVERGFYGYPHDFAPRKPYTLWMMHDFGAGAACGTVVNDDDGLPREMAGNVFIADFGKRQVTRVRVEPDGATYRMAEAEELFPNPPDGFRPVGLATSPDGRAIYICDWQRRDVKENVDVGRLWKLTWSGPSAAAPRPAWWLPLSMGRPADATTEELIGGLWHPARSIRLAAQRALSARGRQASGGSLVADLKALLNDGAASDVARVHALWSLDAIDEAASVRADVMKLAGGAGGPRLSAQAMRQLSQRRVAEALPTASRSLASDSAQVRFRAVTLLGRLRTMRARRH